jgi:hypothetical protein
MFKYCAPMVKKAMDIVSTVKIVVLCVWNNNNASAIKYIRIAKIIKESLHLTML